MNGDHVNHGENQPLPGPRPLLPSPTATIFFDGLIYTAYNEKRRLYQGAVLTQAEGHHLTIEVRFRGKQELLFPTSQLPWTPAHEAIRKIAPLWLFVDSGNGLQEEEFSATLHRPTANDQQSFDRILNFDKLYKRVLAPKRETFSEFNFPHGITYSAQNTDAKLKTLGQNEPATAAEFKENIQVSTLGAIDIDAVSTEAQKKYIVLASAHGEKEFFRFELEAGKHYEIRILNEPIEEPAGPGGPAGHAGHDHENHFLQFYELFDLKDGDKKFLVEPPPPPPSPHSPPCVSTSGDTQAGLPGSG